MEVTKPPTKRAINTQKKKRTNPITSDKEEKSDKKLLKDEPSRKKICVHCARMDKKGFLRW